MAAAAEQHTTHLLADLIVREARSRNLAVDPGDDFTLIPGMGVEILSNGKKLLVGNRKLLADRGVTPAPDVAEQLDVFDDAGQTLIIVAEDDTIAGVITVEDTLRDGIPETIADLKQFDLRWIIPCHCTGWRATAALLNEFGEERIVPGAVGKRFTF